MAVVSCAPAKHGRLPRSAKHGGHALVLASRSGRVQERSEADFEAIIERGEGCATVVRCDAACAHQVQSLACSLLLRPHRRQPALHGVVHAAGVVSDAVLRNQTAWHARHILEPKAAGAQALHAALLPARLRAFSLFTSVVGLLGNAGQAVYAAANSWLDALCRCRRSGGLCAQSTQWSYVAEVGMAARRELGEQAVRLGLGVLSRASVELMLASVCSTSRPACLAVLPASWGVLARRVDSTGPTCHPAHTHIVRTSPCRSKYV